MPNINGDEFESTLSTEQNQVSSNDIYRELRSQTRLLTEINSSVEKILSSGQGYRYQFQDDIRNAYNSNGRNNSTRERQGAQNTRNGTSRNSFEKATDKDIDDLKKTLDKLKKTLGDATDDFENELRGGSRVSIGERLNGHILHLADSLGIELEDLPKTFASQLGKYVYKWADESNSAFSRLAKSSIDTVNNWEDSLKDSMTNAMGGFMKTLFGEAGDIGSGQDIDDEIRKKREEAKQNGGKTSGGAFGNVFGASGTNGRNVTPIEQAVIAVQQATVYMQVLQGGLGETNNPSEGQYSTWTNGQDVISENGENPYGEGEGKQLPGPFSGEGNGSVLSDGLDALNGSIGDVIGGLGKFAASGLAAFGAMAAVELVTTSLAHDFKELKSEIGDLFGQFGKNAARYDNETKQILDNQTKRLMDDVETIVREPFQILEDAANKVYEVWDNELQIINATQGYTKSDMQDLMSNYAARLTEEGLSSVVSAADMTENLAKVLQAGLSGAAAEEFAYIATILNAAIPTQDFFDYADTYVSLAGNMIAQGYSESEALSYANEQLELFASNTLYASRELAGGFTTGLKSASDIFAQSVQIAQTAGTNNAAEISSVLTAVAAITGSIAPDLATSMTDLIYQAAVGGNSSELVALRSLAGTNASNTEFLNALINDPQSVFVTMFTNLDKLINTSNDNYMEVAESLSEIFGISTDALRRIDFNYLADAISNMNVSDASLSENIALLASGETTTSAEQLRMQQINQYLLEEGLAYVVDNEAARFIQQHMWEEQIANDLMEATYGVEMVGETHEILASIKATVANIMTLGIRKIVSGISNSIQNHREENAVEDDVAEVIAAGVVGTGNAQDYYNLTTRGVDLNLTDDLVTLLTGTQSAFSQVSKRTNSTALGRMMGTASKYQSGETVSSASDASAVSGYRSISSMYTWRTNVGKSTASQAGMLSGGTPSGSSVSAVTTSSTEQSMSRLESKVDQMLSEEYIRNILEEGGNYEDWLASARKFGIADMSATLEDLGYVETEVEDYFNSIMSVMSAEESNRFYEREEEFWGNVETWLEEIYTFMDESIYQDALMDNIYQDALIDSLFETSFKEDKMYNTLKTFYDNWYDYIYQHNAYNDSYDYTNVSKIQKKEKDSSQDAIYALAEELTQNTTDLREPTMQTNALLAEILIVVNAIMQNENAETSATSLTDTLSGLALGLFNTTT